MEATLTVFLVAFAGVVVRTVVPYAVKLKNNPNLKWDNKYIFPAVAGLFLSVVATVLMLPNIDPMASKVAVFSAAYTLNDLSRESQKLLGFE